MKINTVDSAEAPAAMGGYSQALQVEGASSLLFVSGQVPEDRNGVVAADFEGQARQVWRNVVAQLAAADMTVANLVKVTTFLSSREHAAANRAIRNEVLAGHSCALTVVIAGIFDEQWLLEIEVVAAA